MESDYNPSTNCKSSGQTVNTFILVVPGIFVENKHRRGH